MEEEEAGDSGGLSSRSLSIRTLAKKIFGSRGGGSRRESKGTGGGLAVFVVRFDCEDSGFVDCTGGAGGDGGGEGSGGRDARDADSVAAEEVGGGGDFVAAPIEDAGFVLPFVDEG